MATYLSTAELLGSLNVQDAGLFYGLISNAPVLEAQTWDLVPTGEYKFTQLSSLPAAGFRKINSAGTAKFANPTRKSGSCKILNYVISLDRQMALRSDSDEYKNQMQLAMASLKSTALYYFFNGDSESADSAEFDGLIKIAAKYGTEVEMGASAGAALTLPKLKEAVAKARRCYGSDYARAAIYCNPFVADKIWALCANTSGSGMHWSSNEAGNAIETFDHIPINIVDTDASGNSILPFTETWGSSSGLCSSLYICTKADLDGQAGGLFVPTQGAPVVTPVQTLVGWDVNVDWGISLDTSHTSGVVRLKGILES